MIAIEARLANIRIDYERIKRQERNGAKRAVRKSLAFIRTKTKTRVLRRRKRVSEPGQPPSIHSKDPRNSLKNILFDYDDQRQLGVVGPIKLQRSRRGAKASDAVPGTLENGGSVTYYEELVSGSGPEFWVQIRRRKPGAKRRKQRTRKVRVRARPAMAVGLQKVEAEGNLLAPWAGAIKP